MDSVKAREFLRRHVLGLLAIFIALSGTAVAAGDGPTASSSAVSNAKFKKLKKRVGALESKLNAPVSGDLDGTYPNLTIRSNAVTTGKLANNAVTNTKIANNAVTETKIADTAVTTGKLADLAVNSAKLGDNAVTSAKILNGEVRAGDLGALTLRTAVDADVPTGGSSLVFSNCAAGERAISGGAQWSGTNPQNVGLQALIPSGLLWAARGRNQTGANRDFSVYAWCLQG
jgi:hypothetical protein